MYILYTFSAILKISRNMYLIKWFYINTHFASKSEHVCKVSCFSEDMNDSSNILHPSAALLQTTINIIAIIVFNDL